MSDWFYQMGRRLGRAAVPAIRRGKWVWNGLTGTEAEVRRAEQELGSALAVEVRSTMGAGEDAAVNGLVTAVGRRLSEAVVEPGRAFRVEVIVTDSPNAMALPGGFVFVSEALVELCERNPDELAFVLGHEMAHVLLGHAWERVLNQGVLKAASLVAGRAGMLGVWLRQTGFRTLESAYARQGEFAADQRGRDLAVAAGFEPGAAVRLFRRLEQRGGRGGGLGRYFASHPPAAERAERLAG